MEIFVDLYWKVNFVYGRDFFPDLDPGTDTISEYRRFRGSSGSFD